MKRMFTIVIESDEDGYYISTVVELPGCHTQAKTFDALIERTKEAISLYLETREIPETTQLNFIGVQRIEVVMHEAKANSST